MCEHDEARRCIYCKTNTPHTISGSGKIARCHECDFAFEYHDFYGVAYDLDDLIDYDEFGSQTCASRPTCDNCEQPIEPNETYATNDKFEVSLCAECFANFSLGAPIPFKQTKLMQAMATAIPTKREGE